MALILEGRYALPSDPVQSGAHSQLYKGTDLERDNQSVAIKLFKPPHVLDDRVLQASWANELEAYQALGDHSNLARLIDWGRTADKAPFLVFEWLEGDLLDHLDKVVIEGWDDFWPIAREILVGLKTIHAAGYVHRDLKPENVLVASDGTLKVADFGTTRLIEAVNLGLTMGPLGTVPYAPPERGTPDPKPAYDLYSFGVLCVVCMTRQVPTKHAEALSAFQELDLPAAVSVLLEPCLAQDPKDRPKSAAVLHAQLLTLQDERELHRQPETEVFLQLPDVVVSAVEQLMGLPAGRGAEYMAEDIAAVAAFAYDDRTEKSPDLQIVGQSLLYRTQPHWQQAGLLRVLRAVRPAPQTLEFARTNWLRPKVRFRMTVPTDPRRVATDLTRLLQQVAEHDGERVAAEAAARESEAFAPWRKVLKAKFAVEDERGTPVRYDGFTQDRSRVRFRVSALPKIEIGENRLIRAGNRRVLFGEVEGVENSELILFVTKGKASDLPRSGILEFDAEASKSKLRREQAALDRISGGTATRPDLRELLLEPRLSTRPDGPPVEHFFHEDLDPAKKVAVASALGAKDFLLVQGPPGTGKTTFISELVAQSLSANPDCRILLASQTHIALDHALARVRQLCPSATLLRLGRSERITSEIETLSLDARLDVWRVDVVKHGRDFLKAYAAKLGIELTSVDIEALASELSLKMDRVRSHRSRIALRQTERKRVLDDIDALRALAPEVLQAATTLERAATAGSAQDLQDAVRQFVDVGVEVASSLEAAAPLNGKLVDLESGLAAWRDDLRRDAEAEKTISQQLASTLGVPEDSGSADLLDLASKRAPINDPRLSQLQEIAEDWATRFGRTPEFAAVVIAGSNVVAATCVGLTGVPGASAIPFDLCIVDEASKATATEVLVPLASSRRWVLVGDEQQLPPFVEQMLESREMLERFELTPAAVRETLFSVLADGLPEQCKVALTHQHRMHPAIGQLISECLYQGTLTSEPRGLSPTIETAFGSAVLWLDTAARSDRRELPDGTTYRNRGEARVVSKLLDRLQWVAAKNLDHLTVAVLTAYEAQRRELADVLAAGELERSALTVRVANVDAYQGQEADVALFSVTRSNDAGDLGFLRNQNRINVALSRAREGLVIVGDTSYIDAVRGDVNPLKRVLSFIRAAKDSCSLEVADK